MPRKNKTGPSGRGPKKINQGTPVPRRSGDGITKRGTVTRRGGSGGKRG